MAQQPHKHCDTCENWKRGYMLNRMRVPSFCDRHFHSQAGDDPACKEYSERHHND